MAMSYCLEKCVIDQLSDCIDHRACVPSNLNLLVRLDQIVLSFFHWRHRSRRSFEIILLLSIRFAAT